MRPSYIDNLRRKKEKKWLVFIHITSNKSLSRYLVEADEGHESRVGDGRVHVHLGAPHLEAFLLTQHVQRQRPEVTHSCQEDARGSLLFFVKADNVMAICVTDMSWRILLSSVSLR